MLNENNNSFQLNNKVRFQPQKHSQAEFIGGIKNKNKTILAKAITLIESKEENDISAANNLLQECFSLNQHSFRIGITGPPGVGKSTFIEQLVLELHHEFSVAVLTIDPTSTISGGSVLGDKTRMEKLNKLDSVFIRPSPVGMMEQGVHQNTCDAITICEAAGFDFVIVETEGIGQTELKLQHLTDLFLLLLSPAGGDDLQGIKRGVMELADLILITKSDNEWEKISERKKTELLSVTKLFPPKISKLELEVMLVSSLKNKGILSVKNKLVEIKKMFEVTNYFTLNREKQLQEQFRLSVQKIWIQELEKKNKNLHTAYDSFKEKRINPRLAAYTFLKNNNLI